MVRLGKWAENKVYFHDTTTGRRGIQWTGGLAATRRDGLYRLCWFGRVTIPARGTATNYGGSARFQKTRGGQAEANVWARTTGTYATSAWGHGIDNVVGALFTPKRAATAALGTTQPTAVAVAILNSTTVRVAVEGFTAQTVLGCLFVWGATSLAY